MNVRPDYIDVPNCRSLKVRETDMFAKTVSSTDAATEPAGMHLRRVLANMSVSCIKFSHRALGVAQIGTSIQERSKEIRR